MSSIIKGLTKETTVNKVNPAAPVIRSRTVDTPPRQNVYEPKAKKRDQQEPDKKSGDEKGLHLIAEKKKKPKPTSPEKWARAKAKARSKFDVYPSAYANAYASKEYKKMGGGWRMGESLEEEALNYLQEKRSDIINKFNYNQIITAVNDNINENKINIRRAIVGLEMGHYDYLSEAIQNQPNNFTLGKPTKAEIDDPPDVVFEYPIYNNGKLIGQFTFSKFFGQFYGSMGGKILPDMPTKFDGSDPIVANKIFNNFLNNPSGQRIARTIKVASIKPQGHRYNTEIEEANPVNVWARSGRVGSVSPIAPDLLASELPIDLIGEPEKYLAQKLSYDITKGRAARDLFYNTSVDKNDIRNNLEQLAQKAKLKKDPSGIWVYDVYSPLTQGTRNHITYLKYMFGDPIKKEMFSKKPRVPDVTSEDKFVEEGWKSAVAATALAGLGALGGAGPANAADLSGFNTQYLQQVATGQHPRPMVSVDDAKAELQARAAGKQQTVTTPSSTAPSGFSKEYLQKAADPNRNGRYMISVEKAQELLKQMNEEQLDEKCWDTHKQVGMKSKGGKMVPNCVPKESAILKGLKR